MTAAAPLVVLAAGGTGGHVFPAQALAAALRGRGLRLALITDRRGDAFADMEVHRVASGGLAGRGALARVASLAALARGVAQAWLLLRRLAPAVVVGFGGYASVPAVLAASLSGRRTVVHEQNAVLGRANRLLAGHVNHIATSFADTGRVAPGPRVVCMGTPVREAFMAMAAAPYAPPAPGAPVHLLVLGGSQGARVFSRLLPASFAALSDDLRARLRIVQQCRPEDLEDVRAAYGEIGIDAELSTFFSDIPERLQKAHLVIYRAGASSVSEVTVVGRPALFVPFPHAIDDHQTANARAIALAGGGWLMDEARATALTLADRVTMLLDDPEALVNAAKGAAALGRRDAAERLADVVCGLIGGAGAGTPGRAAA